MSGFDRRKRLTLLLLLVAISSANESVGQRTGGDTGLNGFASRKGNKIFDGNDELHFLSFNIPELIIREEPYWGLNHPFEIEDAVKTVRAFGGSVTRCYVMSVHNRDRQSPRHVAGPQQYNEKVFRVMDHALETCRRHGVRLIVPFLDNWHWWGGIKDFAALRGKDAGQFYTDEQLKSDYKDLVRFVLNRKNTISGILYKDDPAVFAWETGNELRDAPAEWTLEMAAFIKSIDRNHLVIDGNDHTLHQQVLDSPDVDIVVKHYYRGTESDPSLVDYEKRFRADLAKINGRKPFLVGEFGFAPVEEMIRLSEAIVETKSLGALVWSLRQHDFHGGFRSHIEGNTGFYAYHWPGFTSGDSFHESQWLSQYHHLAQKICRHPDIKFWEQIPEMLPIDSSCDIRWRGVVGATGYDVQRQSKGDEAWKTIGRSVSDSVYEWGQIVEKDVVDAVDGRKRERIRLHVFFQDKSVKVGQEASYRVRARFGDKSGGWSVPTKWTVDKLNGFAVRDGSITVADESKIEFDRPINSFVLLTKPTSATSVISKEGIKAVGIRGQEKLNLDLEAWNHQASKTHGYYCKSLPPDLSCIQLSASQQPVEILEIRYGYGSYYVRPRGKW